MDERDALRAQAVLKRQKRLHSEVSYKRLEDGRFYWPPIEDGTIKLSGAQLSALIEGMEWSRVRAVDVRTPLATQ
jgi:transposase